MQTIIFFSLFSFVNILGQFVLLLVGSFDYLFALAYLHLLMY